VGEADAQQHHHHQHHAMSGGRWAARPAPFTAAQYEELEHQALIYKYLVAGVPVPPDLLLPIRRGFVYHQPARKRAALRLPWSFLRTVFALHSDGVERRRPCPRISIWLFIRIEGFRCPPTPFVNPSPVIC
jgi:hypothetical protein